MLTPPLPLFPPVSPPSTVWGVWGGGQNNNKQASWSGGGCCCCCWDEMRCLHASSTAQHSGWCKPAGPLSASAAMFYKPPHFGENVPACLLFHAAYRSWKAGWCGWRERPGGGFTQCPLKSFSCLTCIYRPDAAGCVALLSAIIAPVSPQSPVKPQPITTTQTKPNIETHKHTPVSTSTHFLQALGGQRMNNTEVTSEWKSPPPFPSFSPSLSNKEAMLPWRQWSLDTLLANYRLPRVKHSTNGSSIWCCCCHRHWNPIG